MFGAVSKIPISSAFNELVEMGFVDYGDYAAFLHIQDTFSRFSVGVFTGAKKMMGNGGNGLRIGDFASVIVVWGRLELL